MKNNFDRFFYERLNQSTRIPPDRVWHRIEQQQTARTNPLKIWPIAAVLALGITAGIFAFRMMNTIQEKMQIVNIPVNKNQVDQIINSSTNNPIVEVPAPAHNRKNRRIVNQVKVEKIQPLTEADIPNEEQQHESEASIIPNEPTAEISVAEIQDAQADAVVIVYSLPATETQSEKPVKATAVDRILNFARDVKSGDVALVDFAALKKRSQSFGAKRKKNSQTILF